MYKALTSFTDLQDKNHRYLAGDIFPRKGLFVSKARIEELSTDKNRRHKPVIAEVSEEVKTKETKSASAKKGGRKKTDVK